MKGHMRGGDGPGADRHRQAGRLVAGWTALVGMAVLCGSCGHSEPSTTAASARSDRFVDLFTGHCTGCHGRDGRLGPAPPTNDPLFASLIPRQDLWDVISKGRPGRLMPGWSQAAGGPLADEQIEVLVAGIRSAGSPEGAMGVPPYRAPPGQIGNGPAGQELFNEHCARCHGRGAKGGKHAGPLNSLAFLELIGEQELRRIAITGRPDLGMPDFRRRAEQGGLQPLDSQQIQDVVAWLASLGQGSGGSSRPVASQEVTDAGSIAAGSWRK
jgi:cytochrome c oxidase cbb3-type subunit 3